MNRRTIAMAAVLLVPRLAFAAPPAPILMGGAGACHYPGKFPSASNTGYSYTGVTLPRTANTCNSAPAGWSQGSSNLNVAGTYDGCYFTSEVDITASNVTVQRSSITYGGYHTILISNGALSGIVVQDTTISGAGGAGTSGILTGYSGSGTGTIQVSLLRDDISGGTNCVSFGGQQGVLMQDVYCHDLNDTSGGHMQGIQNNGGGALLYLVHNWFNINAAQYVSAAVMIDDQYTPWGNELVAGNYLNSANFDLYNTNCNFGVAASVFEDIVANNLFDNTANGFNGYIYNYGYTNGSSCNGTSPGTPTLLACNGKYSDQSAINSSACTVPGSCTTPSNTLTLGTVTASTVSGGRSTISIPYSGTATGTIHGIVDCDNNGTYETNATGSSSPLSATCSGVSAGGSVSVMLWSTNSAADFGSATLH